MRARREGFDPIAEESGFRMKFVSLIAALWMVMTASAQNAVDSARGGQQTLSVDVDLVNVVFTVLDRKGKFITDLKQEHFRV